MHETCIQKEVEKIVEFPLVVLFWKIPRELDFGCIYPTLVNYVLEIDKNSKFVLEDDFFTDKNMEILVSFSSQYYVSHTDRWINFRGSTRPVWRLLPHSRYEYPVLFHPTILILVRSCLSFSFSGLVSPF